jgi:hypothetical protein
MKQIFCSFCLVWLSVFCYGQFTEGPYLLLQKAGSQKQVIFEEGEEIRYKVKGEDHFRKDFIVGLNGDRIVFHYQEVMLSDIEVIDIRQKEFGTFNLSSGGSKVIIAGSLYIIADYVSQTLIREEEGGLSGSTYAVGGGIIAVGILMKLAKKKKFRPGGRYILDIIDLRVR